jgi:maleate isomerase
MSGPGYRARLGFLLPPGNPTIEPELMALVPPGVSLHFHRMVARGGQNLVDTGSTAHSPQNTPP